jgi:ribonuclease E
MKRMLVNATQREELRVAVVDGQKLYDLDIEVPSREQRKANIYKGRITRLEPSLEAAFVEFGADRHGFLPLKEISPEYFLGDGDRGGRVNIREVLREGQEIVVQVEKDERGTKGAALTTYLSLAGRFLVLMPNNPKAGGVSRRIQGDDRDAARETMEGLEVPGRHGRHRAHRGRRPEPRGTAMGPRHPAAGLGSDQAHGVERPAPFLIYQESNAILRALRDHFSATSARSWSMTRRSSGGAPVHGTGDAAQPAQAQVLRRPGAPVHALPDREPDRKRLLARGGTALRRQHCHRPHRSAAVHRHQLCPRDQGRRHRDDGAQHQSRGGGRDRAAAADSRPGRAHRHRLHRHGPQRNQREVENRLREAVKMDRARIQIGRISRFGLLEMSRQRLRPSLGESSHITCPRCQGWGAIRSVESLSLSILRLIGEEARKERSARIIAEVPVDVGTYLLNEKRGWLGEIEQRDKCTSSSCRASTSSRPNYQIRRVRDDAVNLPGELGVSYQLPPGEAESAPETTPGLKPTRKPEQPAVSGIVPATPAPMPQREEAPAGARPPGLWARLKAWLAGLGAGKPRPHSKARGEGGRTQARAGAQVAAAR